MESLNKLPPNILIGCKGTKLRNHFSSTTEEFVRKAVSKHGDRYNYSKVEYVNSRTKVCIMCKKHGEFYVTPDNHLKGRGCPRCKQSRGENMIEAWLQRSNIRYERQFVLINQEIDRPSHRLVIDFFVKHKGRQYFIEYSTSAQPIDSMIAWLISKCNNTGTSS